MRIHRYANVGNHFHLRISLRGREAFQNFLRAIAVLIVRLVTGARKGKPFGKFWDALVHNRVLASRREALSADRYVKANEIEAAFGQEARKNKNDLKTESTGSWTGAGAINTGLVVNVSGGTINYAALFSGGHVGIGTTSPREMLDVNGNIRVAKNAIEPYPCDAAHDAVLALTSVYRHCVCKGSSATWVFGFGCVGVTYAMHDEMKDSVDLTGIEPAT